MAYQNDDLRVVGYRRASQPSLSHGRTPEDIEKAHRNLHVYLAEELRRIEQAIQSLTAATPQVAFKEPSEPTLGMIRYAKSPWNPLGTGNAWVYWNGSAWAAL